MIDTDKDGKLNIMNLVLLFKNLDPETRIGQEVYKLLIEYKNKNILLK